ncbi:PREDICTED: kinase D-interacting substrate of 220 kDa-like [Branchiostoma belcheri]|uniref:Kinase D-interacting substrate of 220 kDa-like n=1 Tax=Branchiostoma belcheri TaxID=7741 RepID=A0A6P4Z3Q6_BRABE|nr:PREDICTED: kinase D-interacting substrate of 220 kDa-like [Branchiostoma belcheri]
MPKGKAPVDPLGYTIHAENIAKILTDENLKMPLSVGIYGSRGIGKTCLLDKLKEKTVNKIKEKGESAIKDRSPFPHWTFIVLLSVFLFTLAFTITAGVLHPTAWVGPLIPTVLAFLSLVLVMLFTFNVLDIRNRSNPLHWVLGIYLDLIDPPSIDKDQLPDPKHYKVIWVNFNAWEFTGCKVLWAGIVTRLCDTVESEIGALVTRFYRCIKKKVKMGGKRILLCRSWFRIALLLTLGALLAQVILLIILAVGIEQVRIDSVSSVGSVLGLGLLGAIVNFVIEGIKVGKRVFWSQKDKLDAESRRPNFTEQLGFMSLVKREVRVVTSLLRFLQRVLEVQYRVIIVIDDLDRCAADRVVGVLEAMKILLSDDNANIITVLAVDQKTVVNCLKTELPHTVPTESSAYEYLKRVVRFSVCLPEANVSGRMHVWEKLREEAKNEESRESEEVESAFTEVEREFLKGVVQVLDRDPHDEDHGIMPYVLGNARHINRLYRVLRMTVRVINKKGLLEQVGKKQVASWVVLVGQWPWRMGWIVQFVEDVKQNSKITKGDSGKGLTLTSDTQLHTVYSDYVRKEMTKVHSKTERRSFNSLDGDPELFQLLLRESKLTVQAKGDHYEQYREDQSCSWEQYLEKMSRDGEWGDSVVLQAIVNMLGHVVMIVSSVRGKNYITYLNPGRGLGSPPRDAPPLLLGYYAENHYVSLEPIEQPVEQKKEPAQPVEQKKEPAQPVEQKKEPAQPRRNDTERDCVNQKIADLVTFVQEGFGNSEDKKKSNSFFEGRINHWIRWNKERVIGHFRKLDKNGDGEVSCEQFKKGMLELGAPFSPEKLHLLDMGNNGTINYMEFSKGLRYSRSMRNKIAGESHGKA